MPAGSTSSRIPTTFPFRLSTIPLRQSSSVRSFLSCKLFHLMSRAWNVCQSVWSANQGDLVFTVYAFAWRVRSSPAIGRRGSCIGWRQSEYMTLYIYTVYCCFSIILILCICTIFLYVYRLLTCLDKSVNKQTKSLSVHVCLSLPSSGLGCCSWESCESWARAQHSYQLHRIHLRPKLQVARAKLKNCRDLWP